jgi:6-phosphogluconolactonase (cycloisomerase 2 family)
VANVGDAANKFDSNITGFRVGSDGSLTPIKASTRKLSSGNAQPSRILFSPDGKLLVVSELSTNHLTTFKVQSDGTTTIASVTNSAGPGPFGSQFLSNDRLIVAEAPADASGALSSYMVAASGDLSPVSASIPNGQTATCWVVTAGDGRFAYTSNTGSSTLSMYSIAADGTVHLVQDVASRVEGPGSGPIDSGVSEDGRFLYVLNGGNGSITAHTINVDGTLTRIGVAAGQGLPAQGAQGLAVR